MLFAATAPMTPPTNPQASTTNRAHAIGLRALRISEVLCVSTMGPMRHAQQSARRLEEARLLFLGDHRERHLLSLRGNPPLDLLVAFGSPADGIAVINIARILETFFCVGKFAHVSSN